MERILTFLNRLLYVIAIALLIIIVLYSVSYVVFRRDSEFTIYPIVFDNNSDDLYAIPILVFLLLGFALAILKFLSHWLVGKHFHNRLGARAVFVAFLANILMFIAMPFLGYGLLSYHDTLNTLYINDHVYQLALYGYDEPYNARYSVYECDRLGVFCRRLYAFGNRGEPELVETPADNSIALNINGEVAWTYMP